MSKSDARFDELFPSLASAFTSEVGRTARYGANIRGAVTHEIWLRALYADDLMRMAASHRQPENLFERSRFYSTVAAFRGVNDIMAGKRGKQVVMDSDKANWQGFVERRLTDPELEELDGWKPKPSEIWAEVDAMLGEGYRLTLSYNKASRAASCTIICDAKDKAWGGYGLSSFDGDCAAALKMAIFKHALLLQRDWTPLLSPSDKPARRG